MKEFKALQVILLSLLLAGAGNDKRDVVTSTPGYLLKDGKIMRMEDGAASVVEVTGAATHIEVTGTGLAYLSVYEDGASSIYYAGYIPHENAGQRIEKKLPLGGEDFKIVKFDAYSDLLYFTVRFPKGMSDSHVLYRLNINTDEISQKENVFDFILLENETVAIIKQDSRYMVHYSGRDIPLMTADSPAISRLIDSRLIFISSGSGKITEVVDILSAKNIYQYTPTVSYKMPDEYNIVIKAVDAGEEISTDEMIFYKVFINGREQGRTETGISQVNKEFTVKLEASTHYIVRLERWELNRAQKTYLRVNNVKQPQPFRLFIPENRIIQLNVIYNGANYSVRHFPVFE